MHALVVLVYHFTILYISQCYCPAVQCCLSSTNISRWPTHTHARARTHAHTRTQTAWHSNKNNSKIKSSLIDHYYSLYSKQVNCWYISKTHILSKWRKCKTRINLLLLLCVGVQSERHMFPASCVERRPLPPDGETPQSYLSSHTNHVWT